MADTTSSVEKVEAVLQSLKAQAKEAHEEKDDFLMGVLVRLIGVCSPIVNQAIARKLREDRAKINKAHAALRKEVRESGSQPSNE